MDFGEALKELRSGKKVTRLGWNGKDMWLELQVPDEHSKMKRPYIFITPCPEFVVPWVASHADMLGEDWSVVSIQDAPAANDTTAPAPVVGGL